MTLKEKKLSVIIEAGLNDLFTNLGQVGLAIDNIEAKGLASGWSLAQINSMKIIEFEKLKKQAQKSIESVTQGGGVLNDMETASGGNYDTMFIWQATGAKGPPCPSCIDLNGTRKTYEDWLLHGLPANAATYCGSACVCVLVEEKEALKNPVIIKRGPKGPRGGKGKLLAVYEQTGKLVTPEVQ